MYVYCIQMIETFDGENCDETLVSVKNKCLLKLCKEKLWNACSNAKRDFIYRKEKKNDARITDETNSFKLTGTGRGRGRMFFGVSK